MLLWLTKANKVTKTRVEKNIFINWNKYKNKALQKNNNKVKLYCRLTKLTKIKL